MSAWSTTPTDARILGRYMAADGMERTCGFTEPELIAAFNQGFDSVKPPVSQSLFKIAAGTWQADESTAARIHYAAQLAECREVGAI